MKKLNFKYQLHHYAIIKRFIRMVSDFLDLRKIIFIENEKDESY